MGYTLQRNIEEAREELKIWLAKWSKKYPKLCNWVEENIEETLTFYNFPKEHHRNLKSTNVLERLNEEIKRRTNVVRIFPNRESCLRLILALAVKIHEQWLESRYLNMDILREKGDDGDGYLFFKNVQLKSHYLNENFFEFSEGIKWLFLNEFAENY